MNNSEKLHKVHQQQIRARELYEQKFNRIDWENKNPEAMKYFKKCNEQAGIEIWGI